MLVAIIGAGAAGLTAARHVRNQGLRCEVFEMTSELGGTWVYTNDVNVDQYGFPIHTAMYQGLRANLPKEVMGFPDFPISEQNETYLSQSKVLEFLNSYADHFKIRQCIRFDELVTEVKPVGDQWQIKATHKPSRKESVKLYDIVMVCNGHYHTPVVPSIPGQENFNSLVLHSHQYRSVIGFENQTVLVIGAGPSGLDIALQVATVAKSVTISHHPSKNEIKGDYPSNVLLKPEVKSILMNNQITFIDDSNATFDSIIYCTGYRYNFPFLHESCGVTVEDNHVEPLYKHMIHIERPTMCFIGIPFYVCAFQMFDLQVRFYCQYLNKSMTLPSQEVMRQKANEDVENRKARGFSKRLMHVLSHEQDDYFTDLATIANIEPIPRVISKIWSASDVSFYNNALNFRNDKYLIIDNDTFIKC